ncbi:hypothetical protein OE88DRAFT_1657708 [Heliocybe sulcata]|uniref:Uncharacterized protein n=1 Tax=Heliocybe sulcata TaxID=5364 RepID=A0A5C3N4U7_9AGAM|nr:hypothetical protein OE88DRAFT_1657708 [Heliocybe sulcata]
MAQYYNSTASTSLNRLTTDPSLAPSQRPILDEDDLNQSIYIFPNPSTIRSRSSSISFSISPSSPFSPASTFSVSGASDYWSGSAASPSSRHATGSRGRTISVSTAAESVEVEVWNWEDEGEDHQPSQNSEEAVERRSRWESLETPESSRRLRAEIGTSPSTVSWTDTLSSLSPSALSLGSPMRGHRRSSARSTSDSDSQIPRYDGPAPHPAIRLPLLSLLSSFLSIDESTLHLLRHTPSTSTLFPDLPCRKVSERYSSREATVPEHGFTKLLLYSGSEDDSSSTLTKGLNVMYEKDEEERGEEDTAWVVWRWMRWAVGQ